MKLEFLCTARASLVLPSERENNREEVRLAGQLGQQGQVFSLLYKFWGEMDEMIDNVCPLKKSKGARRNAKTVLSD